MDLKKILLMVLLVLFFTTGLWANGGSESTSGNGSAAITRKINPDITSPSLKATLINYGVTENLLSKEKWFLLREQAKKYIQPFLPVYTDATITISPKGIQKRSSYDGSYYTYFDENAQEIVLYNPEYLTLMNSDYYVMDGNEYFTNYDKENIRTILETNSAKINENREIALLKFGTPVVFKVIKDIDEGGNPELTVVSLFPKSCYSNNFGSSFDLGIVTIPYNKTIEMEQEQTSRLYAPWISNLISVTDHRDVSYKSYAITHGENLFSACVKNLTTTSRRYSITLDIDTECEGLKLVSSSNNGNVVTSSSEIKSDFTLEYYGKQTGTAILTLKIADEEEGIMYTYSKEYVVEPFVNRDFLTINGIEAATNGNVKLGALTNTRVYLDANLKAISTEDKCSSVLVKIYDKNRKNVLSTKVGVNVDNKSTNGTLAGGWGATDVFSKLNSDLSFTPTEQGEYKVYLYAFDNNGFLLGEWDDAVFIN